MIRFNFKSCVVTSDALSEDVRTLIREKGACDVGFIVDQNVAEQEGIREAEKFLEPKVRIRQYAVVAVEPTTEMVNRYSEDSARNRPICSLVSVVAVSWTLQKPFRSWPFTKAPRGLPRDRETVHQGYRQDPRSDHCGNRKRGDERRGIAKRKDRFQTLDRRQVRYRRYAVLNSRVTLSMPDTVTASTGMDALAHAVEILYSAMRQHFHPLYPLQAFSLVFNNLPKVLSERNSLQHRQNVLLGSCLAGIAISNSDTGACHSISYALEIYRKVPHGLAVGTLLPEIVSINAEKGCRLYAHCMTASRAFHHLQARMPRPRPL